MPTKDWKLEVAGEGATYEDAMKALEVGIEEIKKREPGTVSAASFVSPKYSFGICEGYEYENELTYKEIAKIRELIKE